MPHSLKNYPHKITRMKGRPVNFKRPPKATTMVRWTKKTTAGRDIVGSFRTICHLDSLNRKAFRRWGVEIQVIQPDWNTSVPASAGTHDYDATWDLWIPGVDPWEQQRFFRRNGFACWFRHPPLFGNHIHGFTLPPNRGGSVNNDFKRLGFKVGVYVDGGLSSRGATVTSSQIQDYYNKAYGLANAHSPGIDKSWYPRKISETVFNLHEYVKRRAA